MLKGEFLNDLRKRLKKLPPDEVTNAMAYYEEYLQDAEPEGEAAAIEALGSPAQVASEIIGEYAIKSIEGRSGEKKRGGLKTLWIVLLAVCASPIAIPLAASLLVVIIALIIVVVAVLVSLIVSAVATVLSGLAGFGIGIFAISLAPADGLFLAGSGLVCVALGLALFMFFIWLARKVIKGITWLFARFLKRKGGQS